MEPPSPRPPRSRVLPVLIAGGVIAAAAGGWFWWSGRNRVSTDDAQVDGHIAPIAAKISGAVAEVRVENNRDVKAGDVLVRIDPRDYQAKVDQQRAALAVAESDARSAGAEVPLTRETTASGTSGAAAQLAMAEAEYARAQVAAEQARTSDVAAAEANLDTARANSERAQADLKRMRPLADKEEISRLQFDSYVANARMSLSQVAAAGQHLAAARQQAQNSQAGVLAAKARIETARAALEQSRAGQGQVAVSIAEAASKRASVEKAKANLAAAGLQLSYTTIVAPIDGTVTRKSVEPGQILQPGQSLMTIIPLRRVWVTANFKETQLRHVRPGQKAEVTIDMYSRTIEGRVDSLAGATGARMSLLPPENAAGNFVKVVQRIPVKIVFDSLPPDVVLRPGMNVDATILTK